MCPWGIRLLVYGNNTSVNMSFNIYQFKKGVQQFNSKLMQTRVYLQNNKCIYEFILDPLRHKNRAKRNKGQRKEANCPGQKGKTRARWMAGSDDLTHTLTGANQYLPQLPLTFTFKSALKEHSERGGDNEAGKERDKWKNHLTLSAASIQVPKGPLAFPVGEWEGLHWKSVRQHFVH